MTTTLAFVLLGVALLLLVVWLIALEVRLSRTLRGGGSVSMEEELSIRKRDMERAEEAIADILRRIENIDERLKHKLGTVRTIRFNPFQGTGGNHSFASAFVDEEGSGVVLSSLYSRDKVSIFAKPIKSGHSDIELTGEEEKVLRGDVS
jgi:hypothetical protein